MSINAGLKKAEIVSQLFFLDKIDVTRKVETLNEDGSTSFGYPTLPIIEGESCSISYKKIDNPDTTDIAKNPQISVLQIFLNKTVGVLKGDRITAYKYNYDGTLLRTYIGICNEPNVYPTHQEIQVVLKDNA